MLKARFYKAYDGSVLVITQILLNLFKTGQLTDGNLMAKYVVNETCFDKIAEPGLTSSFKNMRTPMYVNMNLKYIVLWFMMLNRIDNQPKINYFNNYVQLKKVPICSNSTIYFSGLIIDNNTAY